MSDSNQAVFLSYASQDAEAAKRICAALRASGVEVWFDQNELTGGDAWDAKIRGQVALCALFLPVISAATQARLKGRTGRGGQVLSLSVECPLEDLKPDPVFRFSTF